MRQSSGTSISEPSVRVIFAVSVTASRALLVPTASMTSIHAVGPMVAVVTASSIRLAAQRQEAEQVKEIVTAEMENVVQLKVPLLAEAKSGASWYEAK